MCFAQGHNAVTPVRLESTLPQSRVKHSTTEPLWYIDNVQEDRMRHLKGVSDIS